MQATANVDAAADSTIQRTIREGLAGCTVIVVAHRLNSIMDADRVLVLDAGRVSAVPRCCLVAPQPVTPPPPSSLPVGAQVAEYDTPLALLGLESPRESVRGAGGGIFAALVRGTGPAMEEALVGLARRGSSPAGAAGAPASLVSPRTSAAPLLPLPPVDVS